MMNFESASEAENISVLLALFSVNNKEDRRFLKCMDEGNNLNLKSF